MIIRCPECSTGFRLPEEQVTPKGVKVRCSRCRHVFRVRTDAAGEVEFFYRPGDNGESEETKSTSSSPFPHAGLDLKPKKASAFSDLGGDDDDEIQAFEDAFEEDEALEMEAINEEEEEAPKFAPPPAAARKPPVGFSSADDDDEVEEEPEEEPVDEPLAEDVDEPALAEEEEEEPEPLMGRGSGSFGDASDYVDPSFGEDGAHFDPDSGKVVEAKPEPKKVKVAGPRPGVAAAGPPPTQQPRVKEVEKKAPPQAAPKPAPTWDEDDLAPHKIGGGTGTKVVTVLLLLSLVVMGFMGVVAARNDGFIDFKAFPQMLEVAFGDGEYEPRPEWAPQRAATVVRAPQEPLIIEAVHGELIRVGRDDHLYIAKGMVRNNDQQSFQNLQLRGMITTLEGRVLRQAASPVGQNTPIAEFRALGNVADASELLGPGERELQAGGLMPFTMVFSEVPQTVIDGENFLLRVEVANGPKGDTAPVAVQE